MESEEDGYFEGVVNKQYSASKKQVRKGYFDQSNSKKLIELTSSSGEEITLRKRASSN